VFIAIYPVREGAMTAKRIFRSIVAVAILVTAFASTSRASAWSGCSTRIIVQWGDTLSGTAVAYGTTMDAIRSANPGLGWWLYAGQVLCIPAGTPSAPVYYPVSTGGNVHVVQRGETLGTIAVRYGVSVNTLLDINPQIGDGSSIQPGQAINLPSFVSGGFSTYNPPAYNPPPAGFPRFSVLKVTYKYGLLVRAGPGKNYSEIVSPLVSAVKNTNWRYNKDTITVDSKGFVWAEVALSQGVNGYSTGWIMVRDHLGNYFTEPHINP
jgi:LysM repeat protein